MQKRTYAATWEVMQHALALGYDVTVIINGEYYTVEKDKVNT